MNLPDLPRKNKRIEAKIDDLVADWFLANYPYDVAIEVKIKGNKALPHQLIALDEVKRGEFKYKLPDQGRRNPFDIVVLKKAHPFIVECEGRVCNGLNLRTRKIINFII
jgi:hypothetical protein